MASEGISFKKTGYFSSLICDYLDEKPELKQFYNRFPSIENFKKQIEEKEQSTYGSGTQRSVLVSVLKKQYAQIEASKLTIENIESLQSNKTFTVTTGHQLNLFTGPLYFLYKIISTINLCKTLKVSYPDYNFVPIYWMATEDHDFEEINYFNFKGKKIHWEKNSSGAVGNLCTEGLKAVFDLFSLELGQTKNADFLKNLFKAAYLGHSNLADATRYLANELFKDYGLVIIDAADKDLKRVFVPHMEHELLHRVSFEAVSQTNESIGKLQNQPYGIQVNPRDINLFYLNNNLRERIVFENGVYGVVNTDMMWAQEEIIAELHNNPEHFSPNVIMRPLYQEVILPNLCYIGGGGELAYWLQLKSLFTKEKVPFPILVLRNSVLIKTQKQSSKLAKLGISNEDIFLKRDVFINNKVREISNIDIDFSPQKGLLKKEFEALYLIAQQTDKSFLGAVKAQEIKQLKGLDNLEKRLLKAQKKKLVEQVSRMTELQNELFPNQSLQERHLNFSELYLEFGDTLITTLIEELDPLRSEFVVLTI